MPSLQRGALRLLLLVLSACAVAACGAPDATGPVPPGTTAVSLELPRTTLLVGDTLSARATLHPAAGAARRLDDPIWTSSDTTVLRVAQSGAITALRQGRARIRASVGGLAGEVAITVVFAIVSADLEASLPQTRSVSGMLHGADRSSPPTALIEPLGIHLWRGADEAAVARFGAAGGRYMFVLSDRWGYPVNRWIRGGAPPYADWEKYEGFMRDLLTRFRGSDVMFDIWNEPDPFYGPTFWDGTEAQFLETYLRTYRLIREVLGPDVQVAGPSISRYDAGFLKRFADFCLANGCEVNVLTWHELGAHRPFSPIVDNLRSARRELLENPRYAPLRIQEIHINEIIGPRETLNPAATLAYFRALEEGGADAAARACWPEPGGVDSCYNNSLSGLLTHPGRQPRSVWWVHREYAEGVRARVRSTSTHERFVALAARRTPDAPAGHVAVGYSNLYPPALPGTAWVAIELDNVTITRTAGGTASVRATLWRIPPSGAHPLAEPALVARTVIPVVNGRALVVVEDAAPESVFLLKLD